MLDTYAGNTIIGLLSYRLSASFNFLWSLLVSSIKFGLAREGARLAQIFQSGKLKGDVGTPSILTQFDAFIKNSEGSPARPIENVLEGVEPGSDEGFLNG